MNELEFALRLEGAGGRAYQVGGCVRDIIRGVRPHDMDYVVTGIAEETFLGLFPDAIPIGRGFPVYRVRLDGGRCDVAFARSETKSGTGYRGFNFRSSPDTTIEEDLGRRDTTINSMARSPLTGELVDPYGGRRDIEAGIIRATSVRFTDDPVRALRAARQSAQFGYSIDRGTLLMMGACRDELSAEPRERVVNELARALECNRPSLFFRGLAEAGIIDVAYPQIASLVGRPQPQERHPEGDVFEHTMMAVDLAASITERVEVRFAALAHDIGKALTPAEVLPRNPDHDKLGEVALREWRRTMPLPRRWVSCAKFAIREHMRVHRTADPGYITDLLVSLRSHPIGIDGFSAVILADGKDLPDFLAEFKLFSD
ncbi:MAG: HD domain-containing protein, partial [Synergistaceae bacterium]|nr:HD domain-containing protein [Synergistaceae bacterium]